MKAIARRDGETYDRQRSDAAKAEAQWRERVDGLDRALSVSNTDRRTLVAVLKRALAMAAKDRERRALLESQLRAAKLRAPPKARATRR
jgi:hypothetical protein